MRIIAGEHRGRKILSPEGDTTRPITDRVKQSLFDHLAAWDAMAGARVLDLFAGTGSMGLECLSRGAEHVTFGERDAKAAKILKQNIEMLRVGDRSTVMTGDALGPMIGMGLGAKRCGLIFVDPPYGMWDDPQQVERIAAQLVRLASHATGDAILILRTKTEVIPPKVSGWSEPESRVYGSMTLHEYRMSG